MREKKRKMEVKRPPKIITKSSESLAENIKDYYRNSPERKNKVLVIHKNTFFDEYGNERGFCQSPTKIKPIDLI